MKTPRRLEPLLEEGIIDEVHSQLMSGKEAVCYVVSAGGELRVAKVYKEANQRAFQNRASYMEGRNVRSSRDRRAIHKRTTYGKKQLEEAWQTAEVDALFRMHAAGVRVPTPYVFSEGVLLMEMVQDDQERVAPRLSEQEFSRQEALELHRELMRQCALMLLGGLVHADLSEFNVLMAPSGPVIIDFPQAVDAAANNSARRIFVRDTDNLTRFLGRFAPELRGKRFGDHIWRLFERGELTPEMPLDGSQVGYAQLDVDRAQPPRLDGQGQTAPARSRRRAVVEIQTSAQKHGPGGGDGDGRPRRGDGRPAEGSPGDFGPPKGGPRRRRRGGGGGSKALDRPAGSAHRPDGSAPQPEASSQRRSAHDSSARGPQGSASPRRPAHDSTAQGPRPPRPAQEAGGVGGGDASDAPKRRKRRRRRRGGKPPALANSTD